MGGCLWAGRGLGAWVVLVAVLGALGWVLGAARGGPGAPDGQPDEAPAAGTTTAGGSYPVTNYVYARSFIGILIVQNLISLQKGQNKIVLFSVEKICLL